MATHVAIQLTITDPTACAEYRKATAGAIAKQGRNVIAGGKGEMLAKGDGTDNVVALTFLDQASARL